MEVCGRHSKQKNGPCDKPPLAGRDACKIHGGKSLRGMAHPRWQNGRYSKALPKSLQAAYERSRKDPDLIALRDELALMDAHLLTLIARIEGVDDDVDSLRTIWIDIRDTVEQRRRLADTERKRLEALQATMTAEQAMAFVAAVVASVKNHVQDRQALQAISDDLERLLKPQGVQRG